MSFEQNLQNILSKTYQHNLNFFKTYDNELFQKLISFSKRLDTLEQKPRYILEFIKENKEFDIYDTYENRYIYNKKPKQWNNNAIKDTTFNTHNTINLLTSSWYDKQPEIDLKYKKDVISINNLKLYSDIQKYTNILKEKVTKKNKTLKSFNKFIFFGTLLGRHIPKITNNLQTVNHFVYEPNLEIFKLSLFVCDYSLLAINGKHAIFSIMDEELVFLKKFNFFFSHEISENIIYKFYDTKYQTENTFDTVINALMKKDPFIFDYKLILNNIIKNIAKNFNKYKTLNFSKSYQSKNLFHKHNIMFVASGPSLEKEIKWLQKNQNKFIIVSVGGALQKLAQYDIKPDIITTLDSLEDTIINQFSYINQDTLDKTIKIASLKTAKKVFSRLNKNNNSLFTYEMLRSFQEDNIPITGACIGEVTFRILLLLNTKNIYLLGLDLALNQETGHTHVYTDSSHELKRFNINEQKTDKSDLKQYYSLTKDLISVKGNFYNEVITTRLLYISLNGINNAIENYKKETQTIYNLSQNGAFINDSIPTNTNSLDLNIEDIDKTQLHQELLDTLNEYSVKKLKQSEIIKIQLEILQLNNLIIKVKELQDIQLQSYEQLKKRINIMGEILFSSQFKDSFFPEIFLNFYFIINRYIAFVFNDENIENEVEKIQQIQQIWCAHISKIMKTYIKNLKNLTI